MRGFRSGLAVLVLASVGGARAASAQQPVTALRAGRLVDVESGQVRRDQVILVRGERIAAIQPGSMKIPPGARLIDLSRYSVLPGLIDCQTHLARRVAGGQCPRPAGAIGGPASVRRRPTSWRSRATHSRISGASSEWASS